MRWIITIAFLVCAGTAWAQPKHPREAPPPDRAETVTQKAGFVWVGGHWEWRAGKYEWLAGHYERERAGKQWRQGRWERRGDDYVYTRGDWVDAGAPPPPPPPGGNPGIAVGEPNPATPPPGPVRWESTGWELLGSARVNGKVDHDVIPIGKRDGVPYENITLVVSDSDLEMLDLTVVFMNKDRFSPKVKHFFREGQRTRQIDLPGKARYIDHIELLYKNLPGGGAAKVEVYGKNTHGTGDAPPPGSGGPPRWKLERPVVSSYWPIKGKPGSRVVIRGRNFPGDVMVVWGDKQIAGAKVTPDEIVFVVPADATSGNILLRGTRGRPLPVGGFEVAAGYDPAAEARRIDEERRKAAEAAWVERQKQLAKDRAARQAAYEQYERQRASDREQRRRDRIAAIRAKWEQAFLNDPETQDELTLHSQRVAELTRAREVAELSANGKLVIRIDIAMGRESDRHDQRMKALHDAFGK